MATSPDPVATLAASMSAEVAGKPLVDADQFRAVHRLKSSDRADRDPPHGHLGRRTTLIA
jgi:hypothetical protein